MDPDGNDDVRNPELLRQSAVSSSEIYISHGNDGAFVAVTGTIIKKKAWRGNEKWAIRRLSGIYSENW